MCGIISMELIKVPGISLFEIFEWNTLAYSGAASKTEKKGLSNLLLQAHCHIFAENGNNSRDNV
jgi:hypothetical protein